jgi:AP-1-like transcription factor
MDTFGGLDNFWDLSQHPSTFSALPEDDFLALLQKQFPNNSLFDLSAPDGIDPISITSLPIPNPTPPSTDSSPSPPSVNQEPAMSRRQSGAFSPSPVGPDSNDDSSLKRKASYDSMDDEPTHKNAHTGASCLVASSLSCIIPTVLYPDPAGKKGANAAASSRRKSGNPHQVRTTTPIVTECSPIS